MTESNNLKTPATALNIDQSVTSSISCGYIGIVGLPNAGKSTLMNTLIKEKVSAVSQKAQTTRKNTLGILSGDGHQYIFMDTPGVITSHKKDLNRFLEGEWQKSLEENDFYIFALNIDNPKKENLEQIITLAESINKPKLALITKVDLHHAERIFLLEQMLRDKGIPFIHFSAEKKVNYHRENLLNYLSEHLPKSNNYLYDPEEFTTSTMRELTSEMILEQVFKLFGQEIPYQCAVDVRSFQESPRLYKIYVDLVVSDERYKKIVIGAKGDKIKQLGTQSRAFLEKLFGVKIYLDIKVKVKENWNKKLNTLKELGYEIKNS